MRWRRPLFLAMVALALVALVLVNILFHKCHVPRVQAQDQKPWQVAAVPGAVEALRWAPQTELTGAQWIEQCQVELQEDSSWILRGKTAPAPTGASCGVGASAMATASKASFGNGMWVILIQLAILFKRPKFGYTMYLGTLGSLATAESLSQSSVNSFGTFDCNNFQLTDKAGVPIDLKQRPLPARVIDTFAFGNNFEVEELVLRLYEMGGEVSEFHIVEGDKDFTGASKAYEFPAILQSGKLDQWKAKITYHKVQIPEGVKAYDLQEAQRRAMHSEMRLAKSYDPSDILLEGDLDEIVSHLVLQALKNCDPVSGAWNAHIQMVNLYYSAGWTNGNWGGPTTVAYFSESPLHTASSASFLKLWDRSVWKRPNELSCKHGMGLSGWHFAWMLNGTEGLAHKVFIHIAGIPAWAQGFADEAALAKFLDESFYADIQKYDPGVYPSKLGKEDLPQALSEHPKEFPTILRGVIL